MGSCPDLRDHTYHHPPAMLTVGFHVRVATRAGELVYIVGDCEDLGSWNSDKGIPMERSDEDPDLWSLTMDLPIAFKYRHFVAITCRCEHGRRDRLMVQTWETNVHPRIFHDLDLPTDQKSVDLPVAEYGHYDGRRHISEGWLTGQTEIRLSLHSNPIEMWKHRDRNQTFQIKCSPMDLRYKDMLTEEMEDEDAVPEEDLVSKVHVSSSPVSLQRLSVSRCKDKVAQVLNGLNDDPAEQPEFGTIYRPNDYFIFRAQSFSPQYVGYQFDFYLHHRGDPAPPTAKLVGSAYILPVQLTTTSGRKSVTINGVCNRPIGQLTVEFLIVKPMPQQLCDMRVSYSHKWKHSRRPLNVGHRGLGSTYNLKECTAARENTIESLSEAIAHGADYVEFDVHLSKDLVPVVYHDFNVVLTLRQKQSDEIDYFEVPVGDLKMKQLQMLQVDHISEKLKEPNNRPSVDTISMSEEVDPRKQPFPSLRQCFEQIDDIAGFNIEVKYPMLMETGEMEDGLLKLMDLNIYVDGIISEILKYAGKRMIVISCFHPDACLMMRLKQNRYPVMFLCQGDSKAYLPYNDIRTRTLQNSFSFARSESLLGVSAFSPELLRHVEMIAWAKKFGLVIFTWGEMNNNEETIDKLKSLGVDAVIFDRIHEMKNKHENVFKMEMKAKVEFLKSVGAVKKVQDLAKRNSNLENGVRNSIAETGMHSAETVTWNSIVEKGTRGSVAENGSVRGSALPPLKRGSSLSNASMK